MFMLGKSQILGEIAKGNIVFTPFNQNNVGPVSVDLRLGRKFRVFERSGRGPFAVDEGLDADSFSRRMELTGSEVLEVEPGELVLGCTLERLKLSSSIAGQLTGRSRFARAGLAVHVSSSLVQPGVNNVQVLEIVNNSPFSLDLVPGVRICQVTFQRVEGVSGEYTGKFKRQTGP